MERFFLGRIAAESAGSKASSHTEQVKLLQDRHGGDAFFDIMLWIDPLAGFCSLVHCSVYRRRRRRLSP